MICRRIVVAVLAPLLVAACGNGQNGVADTQKNMNGRQVVMPAATPHAASSAIGVALGSTSPVEEISIDGEPRAITFRKGITVQLTPLLITGRKPGIVAECAVRIGSQQLTTVGEAGSRTEVIECHTLDAAGPLPDLDGARRIGLIYESGTPNAEFRTPIVLTERANGQWRVDDDAFDRLDGTSGNKSIEAMSRVLGRQR